MQPVLNSMLSLVVPVYGNEASISDLLVAIRGLATRFDGRFEAIFVVDGSPDRSYALLRRELPSIGFCSRLITLSRNFGAFPAIRVGLEAARGSVIAVMAADLQEPPDLIIRFTEALSDGCTDVAFGVRETRADPHLSRILSSVFWATYRRFVIKDVPAGGVDVFAVTAAFRDRLMSLGESNSSLLAQLFWLGGRRAFVGYARTRRKYGKSAWTLQKKMRYLSDSVFAFTDLPVRLLISLGVLTMAVALVLTAIIITAKLMNSVAVPGYAGTMLTILFFGAFNALGLGVVGSYAWRAFENTKARPLAIIQTEESFDENFR